MREGGWLFVTRIGYKHIDNDVTI